MRHRLLAIAITLALGALAASGLSALAARNNTSANDPQLQALSRRVTTLEQRLATQVKFNRAQITINRIASNQITNLQNQIATLQASGPPTLQTSVQVAFGATDSNGGASATAFCPGDAKLVGGGAGFVGSNYYYQDHLITSVPNIAGTAWTGTADSAVNGRSLEVYAVCATVTG